MGLLALVRAVSPAIVRCELTHLARVPIDYELARTQHEEYVAAMTALGCRVEWLPDEPDLPDAVFVEDTAVVLGGLAVITRPGAESRRPEVASVTRALARHLEIRTIEPPGTLDGGDVLVLGPTLYVGQTLRSNQDGIAQLSAIAGPIGYRVHAVPVTGCLHLKSAVTAIAPDTLLINPGWVSPDGFSGSRLIPVDPSEPGAANALALGGELVHAAEFPATRARLRELGFTVRPVPASELAKAEAGVTCCSLVLGAPAPSVQTDRTSVVTQA